MTQRRNWTTDEDEVLRFLKDQKKIKKWSQISKIMEEEYLLKGRCGKQCRQRYKNHLQASINQKPMSSQEEQKLLKLNEQLGNKWEIIAEQFPNRTANFLKNQIYSKIRKSVRKLNRWARSIGDFNIKQINMSLVYKVVQTNDFKLSKKNHLVPAEDVSFFQKFKSELYFSALWSVTALELSQEEMERAKSIISQIYIFQEKYKNCKELISNSKPKQKSIVFDMQNKNSNFKCEGSTNTSNPSSNNEVVNWQCAEQFQVQDRFLDFQKSQKNRKLQSFMNLNLEDLSVQQIDLRKQADSISMNQIQSARSEQKSTGHEQKFCRDSSLDKFDGNSIEEQQNQNSFFMQNFQQLSQQNFLDFQPGALMQFKSYSVIDQSLFQ